MTKKRACRNCGEEKPVAGVWYLLAGKGPGFACETCYKHPAPDPSTA